MATDTVGGLSGHVRSVTVTTVAALGGILAAALSWTVATGETDIAAAYVPVAVVVVEVIGMRALGLMEDPGAKDVLFVAFMTLSLWFVCSTILLTAGVL
jgi:uncharacterized membrane protein